MSADAAELRRLQSWMQDGITSGQHPASGKPGAPLRASPRLAPAEALDLYRELYARRLTSAMTTMHPALRHALGGRRFSEIVLAYLTRHRPQGHALSQLDEHLADYLEEAMPEGHTVDFLVDLARLERLFHLVYDGPGTEGGGALTSTAGIDVDTRLRPAPCLRLLASGFPVGAYLKAVRQGEKPVRPPASDSFLVLNRRSFRVTVTKVDRGRFAVLYALTRGAPVGEAITVAGERQAEARHWIDGWVSLGFFAGHAASATDGRCPFELRRSLRPGLAREGAGEKEVSTSQVR